MLHCGFSEWNYLQPQLHCTVSWVRILLYVIETLMFPRKNASEKVFLPIDTNLVTRLTSRSQHNSHESDDVSLLIVQHCSDWERKHWKKEESKRFEESWKVKHKAKHWTKHYARQKTFWCIYPAKNVNICHQLKKSSWHAFLQEPETNLFIVSPFYNLTNCSNPEKKGK